MPQQTQIQHFHASHRQVADSLQHALWMAGMAPDAQGEHNPNPMTREEIRAAAERGRSYSPAFERILPLVDRGEQQDGRLQALLCPNDPVNNADGRILVKLVRRGQDWQAVGLNDGQALVEYFFSVWTDNVKGSAEHALMETCKRCNLTARNDEIQWCGAL